VQAGMVHEKVCYKYAKYLISA